MKDTFMRLARPFAVIYGLTWLYLCLVIYIALRDWWRVGIVLFALGLLAVGLWPMRKLIAKTLQKGNEK